MSEIGASCALLLFSPEKFEIIDISYLNMKTLKRVLGCCLLGCALFFAPTSLWARVYDIYPQPQQEQSGQGVVSFTPSVTVVCDATVDAATRERAKQVLQEAKLEVVFADAPRQGHSTLYLSVAGSDGVADRYAQSLQLKRDVLKRTGKYDRHIVHLHAQEGKAEVVILGEHSDATFFGLASLEQILERGTQQLPAVTLFDYADQQSRGLVEGYYGYPYSLAVKKTLMRFMMRLKMNTYMYGAKSDMYHSAKWEQPYPKTLTQTDLEYGRMSQDMVKDLAKTSQATKVNFIWAIHPGNAFVNQPNVVNRIMTKFSSMYDLGVRQFAIFVDDVGVPTSEADCKTNADHLTAVQKAIDAKWNKAGSTPEDRVRPLHFVPQVYTLSWVGQADRKRFFKALSAVPSDITIYTTGWGVWTVPNSRDLATMNEELGRPVAWWWNYPCNDNADEQIYTSDMYTNFMEMRAVDNNARMEKSLKNGLGVVSNPMQQGMVSRIALFSVADYAWNNAAFNNMTSWKKAFKYAFPENAALREAYQALSPYLRWNDHEDMAKAVEQYKSGNRAAFEKLLTDLQQNIEVVAQCKTSANEDEQLLYTEIAPWLLKLQTMVAAAQQFVQTQKQNDVAQGWTSFVQATKAYASLETDKRFDAAALEGLGSGVNVSHRQANCSHKSFFPFLGVLQNTALGAQPFGEKAPFVVQTSASTVTAKGHLDAQRAYLVVNHQELQPKDYVAMSFATAFKPTALQVDEALLKQWSVQVSEDGVNWTRLQSATLPNEMFVKHVAFYNNSETPQTLQLGEQNFSLKLPQPTTLKDISVPTEVLGDGSNKGKVALIDGDIHTFFAGKKNQANGDTYMVTLAKAEEVQDVRICFKATNGDELKGGKVEVSADGKKWQSLMVKGTSSTQSSPARRQKLDEDLYAVDFVAKTPITAQYVRLVVTQPLTNKWLRLSEILVNTQHYAQQFAPTVVDNQQNALPQLVDGQGRTPMKNVSGNQVNYKIDNLLRPKSLSIYWDAASWEGAAPQLSIVENGNTIALAPLSTGVTQVDLANHPKATQLIVQWEGKNVPQIYQIQAVVDDHATTTLTSLRKLLQQSQQQQGKVYDLQGRVRRTDGSTLGLPAGIYIVNGQRIQVLQQY